jgi:VIT1/CCC1 family predicted Fe2+/Mn2+ transporter
VTPIWTEDGIGEDDRRPRCRTVLVGLALMLTGATVGVLSGGPPLRRAIRQLAIGAGAAAVTYGLGVLFEATLG